VPSVSDPDLSDAQLLEAARRGDVAAFNELVVAHQVTAYNVALRTLGNPDDAADATQDAFVSAFRAIKDFRGGSFKAWLARIVVNACYDVLRRRQRRPATSLELVLEGGETDPGFADREIGPERAALSAETAGQVQRALLSLPEEQRALVVLCDIQGFSYEEAAEATGAALGTVKSRLSRARTKLRELLTEQGELPAALERRI